MLFQIKGKQCGVTPSQDSDTLFLGNICKTWTKEAVSTTFWSNYFRFARFFSGWFEDLMYSSLLVTLSSVEREVETLWCGER